MRKNEAGLTILERGDVVRIGKGKVLYTVLSDAVTAEAHIESQNTGKAQTVEASRLGLVESVQSVAYTAGCSVEELTGVAPVKTKAPVKETSAYAKAVLFALNALQRHVYAGTVSRQEKARRRSLNRRQKASRKANR